MNIPVIKKIKINKNQLNSTNNLDFKTNFIVSLYNNILNNSTNDKSILHSSIINKNKIKINNTFIKNKSTNLNSLFSSKNLTNNNKIEFSPIFRNKSKYLFNKKENKNQNNYLSGNNSTMNNSYNISNKSKLKKIIKFNSENNINENKNQYINFSLEYNNTQSTENSFFGSLSFNDQLNKYLKKNNYNYYSKRSLLAFKEKNDIHKKISYLNNFCKNIIKNYKKKNYLENILNNMQKSQLLYDNYKTDINSYLFYIKQQRKREEKILEQIITKKLNLKMIINNLYNQIAKNKFIINECKDIKEFLLKVKYKVSDIDEIPKNILDLYENNYIDNKNDNKPVYKDIITSRKNTFNLINYSNKLIKLPNIINKDISNTNDIDNNNDKQINNEDLYLTKIKQSQTNTNSNIKINEINKVHKRLSYRKKSLFSKQLMLGKNPIFEDPEEFMNTYNKLISNLKKSLEYYNETLYQIQKLKNENKIGIDYLMDEKLEKKCKILLYNLKQDNYILNKRLKLYTKLNNAAGLEENISTKIKNIIFEINSITNIEKKFNIIQFESRLEKYETDNLQTKEEKNKTKNAFLMEILEKIFDYLMHNDKIYKNNPIYKAQYKKIKSNEENIKLIRIRQIQINKLKKKEQEKNKKIIENYAKIRFMSLNKKGMTLYNNSFKKEIIKSNRISSFNETFSFNNFFSLSFERKTNYKQIKNNNIPHIKKGSKSKIKREEMINFLSY